MSGPFPILAAPAQFGGLYPTPPQAPPAPAVASNLPLAQLALTGPAAPPAPAAPPRTVNVG
jgi:hypothetical protein